MAKARANGRGQQKQTAGSEVAPTVAPKEVAFSVRLTAEEHDLLKQAAALRGWTPTNLIRTATLERAKHILNTSRVTTFNFKGLAVRIADQLFKQKTYEVVLGFDEDSTSTVQMTAAELSRLPDDASVVSVRPDSEEFPIEALAELKKAVKFGGGEFLAQILEYCEGLTASKRSDVPSPIDPTA
jgi:uncharacterized protein (DUF1778 family)